MTSPKNPEQIANELKVRLRAVQHAVHNLGYAPGKTFTNPTHASTVCDEAAHELQEIAADIRRHFVGGTK